MPNVVLSFTGMPVVKRIVYIGLIFAAPKTGWTNMIYQLDAHNENKFLQDIWAPLP